MDVCSKCGSPIRSQARFCPHCGNQVEHKPVIVADEGVNPQLDRLPAASLSPSNGVANSVAPEEMDSPAALPYPAAVSEPPSSYEPVLLAIERLFRFLNKGLEAQNHQNIADVRLGNLSPGLMARLSTMCRTIIRQVVEDYVAERTEKYLADDELESAMLLADYAVRTSAGNQYISAKKNLCVLETLRQAQSGQLAPSAIIELVRGRYIEHWPASPAPTGTPLWTEIALVVSSYLKEQRRANNLMPEVARQWVEEYSVIIDVSEPARKALLEAAHQHMPQEINPLSFLKKEERARLFDHLRHLRFEQIRALLHREQAALLQAFSEALYDPFFDQVLPPRKSTPVVFRRVELIPEIKRLMASQDERDLGQALQLLEFAQRDIIDRDHAPVVREWLLYVRARTQGLNRAIPEWQADNTRGAASWEEIWNLAVALFQEGHMLQALQVLIPGMKSQRAPFSHLRFGLFCAVAILRREASYPKQIIEMVKTLLQDNLLKLPLPLSYLTWLWLANDSPEPLEHQEQLSMIDVFHDILDRPITYNRPARPAREISIEEFDRDFQELLATVHKLEHDYVLEAQQESIKIKTRMLEASILISRNVPRRVGIFVDYENLILSLPKEMQSRSEMIAKTLIDHASKYGDVVSSWLCYSPANIRNMRNMYEYDIVSEFQLAGFKIEVPRGSTAILSPKENQSDYVLLECITDAMTESKLDTYIIVSGDHMYYERIRRLLERGNAVCVVSYPKKLSGRYTRLLDNIEKSYMPEEYGEFTIDALDAVFHFTPEQNIALDAEIRRRDEERNNRR